MAKRKRKEERIPMISKGKYLNIDVDTIQFIEQKGKKMHIITDDNTMHIVHGRVEELAKYMQEKAFFRPMKSLVINMEKIIAISQVDIHFISGIHYGLGRNNLLKVRKAYRNYIFGYAPFGDEFNVSSYLLAETNETKEKNENNVIEESSGMN